MNTYLRTFLTSIVAIIGYLILSSFADSWFNLSKSKSAVVIYDTTKPQSKPRVVANRYTLAGSDTMFQILFNQIYSPLDVTPRNLDKLKIWLEQNIKKDTSLNNH